MTTALDTVANYLGDARVLLQDTVVPYRYADSEIVEYINQGIVQAARVRPDLFFKSLRTPGWGPSYSEGTPTTSVVFEVRYRTQLLFFAVGMTQLRDDEDTQDTRAAAFLGKFTSQLLQTAA